MAAPKAGGMRFRGDLQGELKPGGRLPECSLDYLKWTTRQTRQNPARRRARPVFLSRCLREQAGPEETYRAASTGQTVSGLPDLRRNLRAGVILHNGSIMSSEVRWTL